MLRYGDPCTEQKTFSFFPYDLLNGINLKSRHVNGLSPLYTEIQVVTLSQQYVGLTTDKLHKT